MMIRRATTDDATAIARLHADSHRATYELLIDVPYETPPPTDWLALLAGPGLTLVAVGNGALLGFGHAEGDRIETLHIAAAHHRRGIGAALFRQLLEGLRQRSIAQVRFNVLARNAKAIAFYQAQGARRVGFETMTDAPVPYLDIVFRIGTAISP